MKNLILFISLLLFISCSDENDGTAESLPTITTSGSNTFGCKIENEIFLPRRKVSYSSNYDGNVLKAIYEIGISNYKIRISAENQFTNKNIEINYLSTTPFIEGITYQILDNSSGNFHAQYYSFFNFNYQTTNNTLGEIRILKFDYSNKIISATFWFDATNSQGEIIKVREGRFDIKFTEQ